MQGSREDRLQNGRSSTRLGRRARAAILLERIGIGPLLRAVPLWRGLVVLGYHRVGDPSGCPLSRTVFSATEEGFELQLELLAQSFDIIGPGDLDAALARPRGRHLLLTFDDGYREHLRIARMLSTRSYSAAFFPVTGFIDEQKLAWWDEIAWMIRSSRETGLAADGRWLDEPVDLHALDDAERVLGACYRRAGRKGDSFLDHLAEATGTGRPDHVEPAWMSWDEIRELAQLGHAVGGHSVSHPILTQLSVEEQREEVAGCLDRLRSELGTEVDSFAYPSGHACSFDSVAVSLLREQGVRWAFSFRGGWQRAGQAEALDLRRVAVACEPTELVVANVSVPFVLSREVS